MRQSHRATKKKLKPVQLTGPGIFLQKRAPELIAASLLLVIGAMLLCPSTLGQSTHALCLDGSEECATAASSTSLAITTSTAISLAMSPSAIMEVIPTSTGATSSASTKLAVSTNSKDGYALYMQTGNSTGDLLSTSTTNTISKISNTTLTSTSLEGLEKNTYGYAISTTAPDSSTKYSPLPTTGGVIQKTDSTTGSNGDNYIYGDTYYLAFGTKVGTDLEAGSYTGTVTVSAVANPKTLASMFDLTYMQEMSSDICANTREGYTKQLIDTRDGKSYWVAKLKDGNCWMTQNLAFTITQEMIDNNSINSTNTDLHPNDPSLTGAGQLYTDEKTGITYWNNNEVVTYRPSVSKNVLFQTWNQDTTTYSWDFGKFVLLNPISTESCIRDITAEKQSSNISLRTEDSLDACMNLVNVSSWSPTFTAQEGKITRNDFVRKTVTGYGENGDETKVIYVPISQAAGADKDENGNYIPYEYSGIVAVDFNNKTYDAHYLLGNYYQWNTMTAGTSGNLAVRDKSLPSTICPKGWTLPSSWVTGATRDGSYRALFYAYDADIDTFLSETQNFRAGYVGAEIFYSIGATGRYATKTMSSSVYQSDLFSMSITNTVTPVYEGWGDLTASLHDV